jgi:hypothetical protein
LPRRQTPGVSVRTNAADLLLAISISLGGVETSRRCLSGAVV